MESHNWIKKYSKRMFDTLVYPYIKKEMPKTPITEPIYYMIDLQREKSIMSRSTLALEAAGWGNMDKKFAIPIASSAEVIWASILLYDDLVDNDDIRYYRLSGWKKYGINKTVHSASIGVSESIKFLKDLDKKILLSFLDTYRKVCEGQILHDNLTRESSFKELFQIYELKTALSSWSVYAGASVVDTNKKLIKHLLDAMKHLNLAGQIMNDYKDTATIRAIQRRFPDIRTGTINYIILHYLKNCSKEEEKKFDKIFGRECSNKEYLSLVEDLSRRGSIDACVKKCILETEKAIKILSKLPESKAKKYFIKEAERHKLSKNSFKPVFK